MTFNKWQKKKMKFEPAGMKYLDLNFHNDFQDKFQVPV